MNNEHKNKFVDNSKLSVHYQCYFVQQQGPQKAHHKAEQTKSHQMKFGVKQCT